MLRWLFYNKSDMNIYILIKVLGSAIFKYCERPPVRSPGYCAIKPHSKHCMEGNYLSATTIRLIYIDGDMQVYLIYIY